MSASAPWRILGLQVVIFAIRGDDGDPPDAVVAVAFVLFWGAVLVALTVAVLAVRRRIASTRTSRGDAVGPRP